jgi:hypothetical protein
MNTGEAMRRLPLGPSLFDMPSDVERRRLTPLDDFDGAPAFLLDIPETIPQLGYGSHQFFRYYGKFPSVVGREIVKRFGSGAAPVLDCYAGSGTTLVEAQIAGCPSYGIDINPLAVLACEVKTRYYERAALRDAFETTLAEAMRLQGGRPPAASAAKVDKWFTPEAVLDLGRIREAIEGLSAGPERDFVTLAFLGVVRRCSNAFDGEVRPHVNRAKRPRAPFAAFSDKFEDMMAGLNELDEMRPTGVHSGASIGDSREASVYSQCPFSPRLVVAHPPYLNSFNYLQVFSLEFMWSDGLDEVWRGWSPSEIRALEHRAWPAIDASVVRRYYEDFFSVAKVATAAMQDGGVFAVVVGDATIRKSLEPVHRVLWDHLKASGLRPLEMWFRTTHYGIGKYAYSHRADYHGNGEKRDAIMFFEKATAP